MIDINQLNTDDVTYINEFTKDLPVDALVNGNSLRMELELRLVDAVGINYVLEEMEYIHPRITNILDNIQVKKINT